MRWAKPERVPVTRARSHAPARSAMATVNATRRRATRSSRISAASSWPIPILANAAIARSSAASGPSQKSVTANGSSSTRMPPRNGLEPKIPCKSARMAGSSVKARAGPAISMGAERARSSQRASIRAVRSGSASRGRCASFIFNAISGMT